MGERRQFDAFISYRHTEPDKAIAERLHRMLETFKVPKAIIKKGSQKKVGRVFRDRDELPTSSNLADSIQIALESSEHLIVICSPRTPQSQWVLKEIETFSALHGHEKILALLIEGEPSESFPPCLRFAKKQVVHADGSIEEKVVEVEPLAADIRDKSLSGMKKKLKTEILRLLAPVLNCSYDDLKQRHRERAVKRILTASISLSVFFLGFGSITAYQSNLIKQQAEVVKQQSEIVKEQSEQVKKQAEELKEQVKKTQAGQSLYLSDVSTRLLNEGDRRTAILVALEALPKKLVNPERPYLEEAEFALSEALMVYKFANRWVSDIALKHDKEVNFIKLSPDTKTIVSSSQDGYLYIWDTEYGLLKDKFYIGETYLKQDKVVFKDDSSIICLADSIIFCLDLKTLEKKWEHQAYATLLAISPDEKKVALALNEVTVLDTDTGEILFEHSVEAYKEGSDGFGYISCMRFDTTGQFISVGTSIGYALIFDIEEKNLMETFKGKYPNIKDIAISDGKVAIAANLIEMDIFSKGKGYLEVYQLEGRENLVSMPFDYSVIDKLYFHPDNSNFLLFAENEKINVVDIAAQKIPYTFIHGDSVSSYFVSQDSVFSTAYDGTIRVWFMREEGYEYQPFRVSLQSSISQCEGSLGTFAVTLVGSDKALILRNLQNKNAIDLVGNSDSTRQSVFTDDGKKLLTCTYNSGEIALWDIDKRQRLAYTQLEGETRFNTVLFVDGESKIFSMVAEEFITVYDANTLKASAEKNMGYIYNYAFSPDKTLCAILTNDGLKIIRTSDLTVIKEIPEITYLDNLIIFNDNSRFILSGKFCSTALYDLKTGQMIRELPEEGFVHMALSNDNKTMALIKQDDTIKLLDAQTFEEVRTIKDFNLKPMKLFIDPSDRTLFISFNDYSVNRYDLRTGALVCKMDGLSAEVDEIIYNRDKTLFITVGLGQSVIWRDETSKKLGQFIRISGVDREFKYLVFSRTNYAVVLIPYYSLSMLLDEAKVQLGEKTLTDEEKEELFIVE